LNPSIKKLKKKKRSLYKKWRLYFKCSRLTEHEQHSRALWNAMNNVKIPE